MYIDLFGKKRFKLGLHHHTTCSDGRLTPEEVVALYRSAGYDAIALTDHWHYTASSEQGDFRVLNGAEYNTSGNDGAQGVYHVLALLTEREPCTEKTATVQEILDAIHEAGGLAVLAHPAWSLNTPEMIRALRGVDATEIYNTVSDKGMSRRADSSLIVDMLASEGIYLPLFASDDSHYYGEGNAADATTAFIMVECDSPDNAALRQAILEKKFYASTGPEIHLSVKDGVAVVDCSPATEIALMSNVVWCHDRVTVGEDLTHYEYKLAENESYIRAFVTDREGRRAWSNVVPV